jgi:hypothetical protein
MRNSLIHPWTRLFCYRILLTLGMGFGLAPWLWAESTSQTVEVVARIEPHLSLTVTPETGDRIDFGTIYSSQTEARLSEPVRVTLRVFSNLAAPYEVTHQLTTQLTNEAGASLSPDELLIYTQEPLGAERGPADHLAGQPRTLFSSDPRGQSMDQVVSYQLRVPPGQAAGTYRGTLVMTVTAQ